MSVSREVELKLELPVAAMARLLERRFNRRAGGRGIREHLVSSYFDTGKRTLRKQGLTLRVRSYGDRFIQTVKAVDATSACLFDRVEWETEIEGHELDLKAAAQTPVGDILRGSRASKLLVPIFKTVVDRTTWRVEQGVSEIEVALDEGRVSARGLARPIAELELELKSGSGSDLFALASSLDGVKDLKIGVLSKSERGYALADGDRQNSFKAEPIALAPDLPVAGAFQIIASACIRHFRLNEPLLIASRSAEPLHQSRVAIRRLRAALSLFHPVVIDQEYTRLKRCLRDVSHRFGEARNLDVYIANIKVMNADDAGQSNRFTVDPVGKAQTKRNRAYERVIRTLGSKRFRQIMQDLVAWIQVGLWCTSDEPGRQTARDQNIEDFAACQLEKSCRKLKQQSRHLDRLRPEKRHRIRIEAKKLRYASEFLSGLLSDHKHRKRYQAFIAALDDLQARLGDLNDIQIGHEIAAELASHCATPARGSGARRAAARHHTEQEKRTVALLLSACEARKRLSDAKPFWKTEPIEEQRHISRGKGRACSLLSPDAGRFDG